MEEFIKYVYFTFYRKAQSYKDQIDQFLFQVHTRHVFLHCCLNVPANGSTVQYRCTSAQFARSSEHVETDGPPVVAEFKNLENLAIKKSLDLNNLL